MDALGHDHVFTMANAGSCPKCTYVFPAIEDAAPTYFEQGYVTCSECQAQADLWDVVLRRALAFASLPMCIIALGGRQTSFTRKIEADKYHEIDLAEVGIPADATVLQVGYTPQVDEGGAVFPIEWHGNVPQRRIVGNVLRLIGRAGLSGNGTLGSMCPVSIWVLWVPQQKEEGWSYVVGAFDAFMNRHYDRVIVPAQSALEISLMPVVRELLLRHASVDNVNGFMGDRLTFGNAINVILPFLCAQAGLRKLPDKIRGSLNKLRDLRNDIVHEGTGGKSITAQQAAEGLCAAVFGFEYVRYVAPELLERLK